MNGSVLLFLGVFMNGKRSHLLGVCHECPTELLLALGECNDFSNLISLIRAELIP